MDALSSAVGKVTAMPGQALDAVVGGSGMKESLTGSQYGGKRRKSRRKSRGKKAKKSKKRARKSRKSRRRK
mgnify:CR=1 FL=1